MSVNVLKSQKATVLDGCCMVILTKRQQDGEGVGEVRKVHGVTLVRDICEQKENNQLAQYDKNSVYIVIFEFIDSQENKLLPMLQVCELNFELSSIWSLKVFFKKTLLILH